MSGSTQRGAAVLLSALLCSCLGYPEGVEPVRGFELDRYLGRWYEIARLDHSFERGLQQVTAEYALQPDGSVSVVNRGYSPERDEWRQASGVARFVRGADEGYLKVSFFGPFYGSYVVFELDQEEYQWAFVSGPNTSYLWLLARAPDPGPGVVERFESRARALGFDTSALIRVDHGASLVR